MAFVTKSRMVLAAQTFTLESHRMTKTKSDLANKIFETANEHWKNNSEAILLSVLGPKLTEWDPEYKSILSGSSLRQFIESHAQDVKIAQHPKQYARIGVYPASNNFSYENIGENSESSPDKYNVRYRNRQAFYHFINALSNLDDDDIKDIHIPVKVIIRLLEGK